MGRTLTFLARIVQDGWSSHPREIGVDENIAVLLAPDGKATVVGKSTVYFMEVTEAPEVCRANEPLTLSGTHVFRQGSGGRFDLTKWQGTGGLSYTLSVHKGTIDATLLEERSTKVVEIESIRPRKQIAPSRNPPRPTETSGCRRTACRILSVPVMWGQRKIQTVQKTGM